MTVVVGLAAGAAVAAVLWLALRDTFATPLFARRNHRGIDVPAGAGILLSLTAVALAGVERGLLGLGVEQDTLVVGDTMLVVAIGFGLLGLLDDLAETGEDKGFAGHLRALRAGRLTTGGLKLLGGGALAVAVTGGVDASEPARLVVDALLVALAANLGNLLDRAPGRAAKWSLLAYLPLAVVAGSGATGLALAVVAGATAAFLVGDLRERFMLGDTGANALGAALGMAAVLTVSAGVRNVVAVVLLALTLLSEVVSFSRIIERVAPLRAFDRIGRLPMEAP